MHLRSDDSREFYISFPGGRSDRMIESAMRDLTGRIRHLLSVSPIADVRHIQVERHGDQVLLQGRVRTFYAKQMAQETARRAAGEVQIVNSVNVE